MTPLTHSPERKGITALCKRYSDSPVVNFGDLVSLELAVRALLPEITQEQFICLCEIFGQSVSGQRVLKSLLP